MSGEETDSESDASLVLSELQLLSSMYAPSELHFDDAEIPLKVENGIPIPSSVSLSLKLDQLHLHLRLPQGYPSKERISASVSVHGESKKEVEKRFQSALTQFLKDGKPTLLELVTWVSDTFQEELEDSNASKSKPDNSAAITKEEPNFCRLWIHSHHIYNEKKRKFIVDTAGAYFLSGFSLPGKPGFVCVEGEPSACDQFWTQLRQLTWQKISLIERQLLSKESQSQAFQDFQELLIDKSSFIKYLEEKGISDVIKGYLGF